MRYLNGRTIGIVYMLYFMILAFIIALSKVRLFEQYFFEKTAFGITTIAETYYITLEGGLFTVIFFCGLILIACLYDW